MSGKDEFMTSLDPMIKGVHWPQKHPKSTPMTTNMIWGVVHTLWGAFGVCLGP